MTFYNIMINLSTVDNMMEAVGREQWCNVTVLPQNMPIAA